MSKATVPGVSTTAPVTVRWDVFFIASTAVFLVSVDTTVLFAAFSALRAGFPDSSTSELSWGHCQLVGRSGMTLVGLQELRT